VHVCERHALREAMPAERVGLCGLLGQEGVWNMTGMISKYAGRCACGNRWEQGDEIYYVPGGQGFFCSPECAEQGLATRSRAQTPPKPSYTPPTAVCAPNAAQSTQDARQEAIAKAHDENIMASAALTSAVLELTKAIKEAKQ